MNTLNRRMFANGDVANAQQNPEKMIDIPKLINYYVSQGYNSVDIKEMLPDVPFGDIEAMVSQLGGSVNPGVASPNANEFTGDINPFVQIPETTVTSNQAGMTTMNPSNPVGATPPELPSLNDISIVPEEIRNYIEKASKVLDEENLIQGLKISFGLNDEEARRILGMVPNLNINTDIINPVEPSLQQQISDSVDNNFYPTGANPYPTEGSLNPEGLPYPIGIDADATEYNSLTDNDTLFDIDGLPNVTGIGASLDLKGNQYKDSDGVVHEISSELLKELLSGESSRIIKGILSNPNVSYGIEIAKIIEAEALGRSSTLVDPSKIRVGAQDIILNPEAMFDETLKFNVDFAKEGAEGIFNTLKGVRGSRMVGIFRGREAAKKAKAEGRDEYKDYFDTALNGSGTISENIEEISQYGNTGGETAKTLDSIILEASLSGAGGIDTNQEDLKDLEKNKGDKGKANPKDAGDGTEAVAGTKAEDGKGAETGTSANPAGTAGIPGVVEDDKDEKKPSDDFEEEERSIVDMIGTAFNSDANLRMMRNVGKALTQYGNLAEGIGVGSAAASEERALRDLEDEAAERELLLKGFEGQTIDYKEAKEMKDNNKELAANIRSFQKNQKNVTEIDKVLDIIDQTQGRAFGVVGAIAKLTTAAAIAAGKKVKDWDSLDARTKIDAITKVLQQSNIQEILGESGRTISNLDREVIKDVFGSMTIFTSEAEIVKKLEDSRAKTLTASNQTRGEIAAGKDYFDITGRESIVISKNKDLIDLILKFDPDDFMSKSGRKVVDVDYRKEFNR